MPESSQEARSAAAGLAAPGCRRTWRERVGGEVEPAVEVLQARRRDFHSPSQMATTSPLREDARGVQGARGGEGLRVRPGPQALGG